MEAGNMDELPADEAQGEPEDLAGEVRLSYNFLFTI